MKVSSKLGCEYMDLDEFNEAVAAMPEGGRITYYVGALAFDLHRAEKSPEHCAIERLGKGALELSGRGEACLTQRQLGMGKREVGCWAYELTKRRNGRGT